MLDILKDYLATAVTIEMKDAIVKAHHLFDIIQLPDYEKGFEEILMLDDTVDQGVTQSVIIDLTKSLQHKILLEHGVTLHEDADMEVLSNFIQGIILLQSYSDRATILRVAALPGTPEEVFAELIALVVACPADELVNDIESVNQLLIGRICDMAEDFVERPPTEAEQIAQIKYKNMFTRISELFSGVAFGITPYLQNGLDLGYPFLIYITLIGTELEELPIDLIALNLFMLAMISEDGIDKPRAVIQEHIGEYIFDIDKVTRIDIEIGNLLLKLNNDLVGGIRAEP